MMKKNSPVKMNGSVEETQDQIDQEDTMTTKKKKKRKNTGGVRKRKKPRLLKHVDVLMKMTFQKMNLREADDHDEMMTTQDQDNNREEKKG